MIAATGFEVRAKQKRRCYQRRFGAPTRGPAHFDWRWRERPALALLAWEADARDPLARLRRIQGESIGTAINFRPTTPTPGANLCTPRLRGNSRPRRVTVCSWKTGVRANDMGSSWLDPIIT